METLKVMIVDDEIIFRELLITTVKWEALGLRVCCEARNGLEALENAAKYKPDIALIDINMPNMDGLTLSEKLKEAYPCMALIVVTGHSEFEYARKAVKLGIIDYILKPFDDDELMNVLLKSKSSILKMREEESLKTDSKKVIREKLLNQLIGNENNDDDETIKKQLYNVGISSLPADFSVASVEIDNMYRRWENADEVVLWKYAVSNIMNELLDEVGGHFVFNGPEGRIISIIECDNGIYNEKFVADTFDKLCYYVNKYFSFTVTVGLGKAYNGFKMIRISYMESLSALQNKMILGNNRVIDYSTFKNEFSSIGFYSSEINEDVLIALRMHNWQKIEQKINEVFRYINTNRLSIDYTYVFCTGLISLCLSHIIESGNEIRDLYGEHFMPLARMREMESIDALQEWILDMFRTAANYCGDSGITRSRKTVDMVKEYIGNQYGNSELCLEKIANNFHINSDYLRSLFRKEMGITITEYITNIRMQQAKRLLSPGTLKLSAISDMVGYNDAGYFSKCFKKFFGMSPSEYEIQKIDL